MSFFDVKELADRPSNSEIINYIILFWEKYGRYSWSDSQTRQILLKKNTLPSEISYVYLQQIVCITNYTIYNNGMSTK